MQTFRPSPARGKAGSNRAESLAASLTGQESLCQLSSASGEQDTLQDTSDSSCDSCHKHVTWPWVYSVLPSRSLALCTPASKIFIFQQTSLQRGNKFLTMTFGCSEFFFHLRTKQVWVAFYPKITLISVALLDPCVPTGSTAIIPRHCREVRVSVFPESVCACHTT